jgi:capsular exopolysaccharide synthesis family protein
MSHIFDALQRSEAERAGSNGSARPAATELLERAEQQAMLRWKAEVLGERSEAAPAERDMSSAPGSAPVRAAAENNVETAPANAEERARIFAQIRPLESDRPLLSRLVAVTDSDSAAAEAFRLLAVRMRHLRRDRALRRVLITSSIPQEGKSLVSANLACTLAAGAQQKVVLLEGDLRRPSLMKIFGLDQTTGISEWLQGGRNLTSSIYRLETPGIWIMPAGDAPGNPLELMQSGKLTAMVEQLTAWFDWVLIDSPPVMPLADTSIWSRLSDGILLVARQGITEKRQLKRGLEAIESRKLIGALLNSSTSDDKGYYYYRRTPGDGQSGEAGKESSRHGKHSRHKTES